MRNEIQFEVQEEQDANALAAPANPPTPIGVELAVQLAEAAASMVAPDVITGADSAEPIEEASEKKADGGRFTREAAQGTCAHCSWGDATSRDACPKCGGLVCVDCWCIQQGTCPLCDEFIAPMPNLSQKFAESMEQVAAVGR